MAIAGQKLEHGAHAFGELSRTGRSEDPATLRARLVEDGYLYIPGFFEPADVLAVRGVLVERLAAGGWLTPGSAPMDAVAIPGVAIDIGVLSTELADDNEPMRHLLYEGRMIRFYEELLGGPIRHFDFTWIRTATAGNPTKVHTDIVFMGRGTTKLYTSWVPYGDIPVKMGGLTVLERSHEDEEIRDVYGRQDVDSYCENLGQDPGDYEHPNANPYLTEDPAGFRRRLGGRWLTADFRVGDLLVFGMYTAHGALDNRTDSVRLSSDSRYQLASEPVDDRWIGPNPAGHRKAGKRGIIC